MFTVFCDDCIDLRFLAVVVVAFLAVATGDFLVAGFFFAIFLTESFLIAGFFVVTIIGTHWGYLLIKNLPLFD